MPAGGFGSMAVFPPGSQAAVFRRDDAAYIAIAGKPRLPEMVWTNKEREMVIISFAGAAPCGGEVALGVAAQAIENGGSARFKFRTIADAYAFCRTSLSRLGIFLIPELTHTNGAA